MLRAYRRRLPPTLWHRACIRSMHVLDVSRRALSRRTRPEAGAEGTGGAAAAQAGMSWATLDIALEAMLQYFNCVIYGVLQEPAPTVRPVCMGGASAGARAAAPGRA